MEYFNAHNFFRLDGPVLAAHVKYLFLLFMFD